MMRLPHGLYSSGGVPDPDGPASLGGGAAREGVGEAGGVVVLNTSDPWGSLPRAFGGSSALGIGRRRPRFTVVLLLLPPPPPHGPVTKTRPPVQPG
jgi:hypothetical protein